MSFEQLADREYAHEAGRDRPDLDWILSDRDVWYPNPFFKGKRGPHPESVEYEFPEFGFPQSPEDEYFSGVA